MLAGSQGHAANSANATPAYRTSPHMSLRARNGDRGRVYIITRARSLRKRRCVAMAQSEQMLDIAVIGAGPVGLASAAAVLQKLGANTKLQVVRPKLLSKTQITSPRQPALLAAAGLTSKLIQLAAAWQHA